MAELASVERAQGAPGVLEVSLMGKIDEVRYANERYFAVILTPGPDQYSSAVPYEVRSDRQLGKQGDVVDLRCRVGGYFKKSYQVDDVDPRTGQVLGKRTVRPVVNCLDVI